MFNVAIKQHPVLKLSVGKKKKYKQKFARCLLSVAYNKYFPHSSVAEGFYVLTIYDHVHTTSGQLLQPTRRAD